MSEPLLEVADLRVAFGSEAGRVDAVSGLGFTVGRGETVAIVGESGSGKSASALAIMGLLPESALVTGSARLNGRELIGVDDDDLSEIRGNEIAMIFQDPLSSLTPVFTVGAQIVEALQVHRSMGKAAARARAVELLDAVGIPDPHVRANSYPHQLSGGQRQRVMIAMAIANEPDLIIADEPTTALDVTVAAQVLTLLATLQHETDAGLVLITHDFGVVARLADDVVVMHGGRAVEHAPVEEVFDHPQDPYTVRLLDAVPRIDGPMRGLDTLPSSVAEHSTTGSPVLSVTDLTKTFAVTSRFLRRRTGEVQAVKGVSFDVEAGQTLAIVGESGSGKSTTLHEIMGFSQPPGVVRLTGVDPSTLRGRAARALRNAVERELVTRGAEPIEVYAVRYDVDFAGVDTGTDVHRAHVFGRHPEFVCGVLERVEPLDRDRPELPGLDDREPARTLPVPDWRPLVAHLYVGGARQQVGDRLSAA